VTFALMIKSCDSSYKTQSIRHRLLYDANNRCILALLVHDTSLRRWCATSVMMILKTP